MKKLLTILLLAFIIALPISCVDIPTYEEEYFSVTFGGEMVEERVVKVKKDDTVSKPQTPLRDGYEFLYWAVEDGKEYDFEQPITQNTVLHAIWNEIQHEEVTTYTVRFFGVDGELIGKPQLVAEGTSAISPAVSVSDFFAFNGWDKDFSFVTEDMDVYASQRYNGMDANLFTYIANSDSTYTITGIKENVKLPQLPGGYVKLALPTEYNGLPITAIADGEEFNGAFSRYNILSVYIPSCYERIGAYAFYGNPSLSQVTFCEGLKEIGEGAFMATYGEGYVLRGRYAHSGANAYVSALTQVELPASLEKIGDKAFNHIGNIFQNNNYVSKEVRLQFAGDSHLAEIGVGAFEGVMLREIKLPNTQRGLIIKDNAFAADTYLNWVYEGSLDYPRSITTYLSLPETVEYIGDRAFLGLGNMSSFYNGACTNYVSNVALSCGKFNVEYIGENAFFGVQLVGSINISSRKISSYAFYGQILSSIVLDGVQEIGEYAFARKQGEKALTIDFGNALLTIGEGAFLNNVGLNGLVLPDTLVRIEDQAFEGCSSLSGEIIMPSELMSIGNNAFHYSGVEYVVFTGNTSIGKSCFESSSLREVNGNMRSIGANAFSYCANLTSVELPQTLTELPVGLFKQCSSLKSIWLPDSISKICENAFSDCVTLQEITLPQQLETIEQSAFEGCNELVGVVFEGNELVEIHASAFAMCCSLTQIDLPDSVEFIGDYVFRGSGLTSFRTPASIVSMGWRVFYQEEYVYAKNTKSNFSGGINGGYDTNIDNAGTIRVSLPVISSITISRGTGIIEFSKQGTFDGSKVTRFEVEGGNEHYSAVDGILYSSDKKKLVMYIRDESVSRINIPEGLVEIADGTFYNNPYLYSVTLPQSLRVIGDYAFYNCANLRTLTLPSGLVSIGDYAFAGTLNRASELSTINFAQNSSLISIGVGAFSYNKGLKSIKLPSSLVTLGNSAFYSATNLATIDLSSASNLVVIGDHAFSGDLGLTPKIESIDFSNCHSLNSTGKFAFASCLRLSQINFGHLEIIDAGSFSGCISITKVKIGGRITHIGDSAFRSCVGIEQITIEEENVLEVIGAYAFAGNITQRVNYDSLDLANALNLQEIGDYAFAYGKIGNVVLPDSAYVLGEDVFNSCSYLTDVSFGKRITQIGENVFRYCYSLTELNIPSSVTVILKDAFRGLKLTKVYIGSEKDGNSIEYMGKNVFFDCKELTEVYIYGSNVPVLFGEADNLSFHFLNAKNELGINEDITIYIDKGMTGKYVQSGIAKNGWEIYDKLLSERN